MGRTGYYSPLFTGEPCDRNFGVRIEDYPAFEELMDRNNCSPKVEWEEEDAGSYPQVRYAYLYGFQHSDGETYLDSPHETFSLRNVGVDYGPSRFFEFWTAVATTCEPFSVFHPVGYGSFPTTAQLAFKESNAEVYRIDCEPGRIDVVEVSIPDGEETVVEEHEWDAERYLGEREIQATE